MSPFVSEEFRIRTTTSGQTLSGDLSDLGLGDENDADFLTVRREAVLDPKGFLADDSCAWKVDGKGDDIISASGSSAASVW
eukprot:CAMPEP_0167801288 /NCGR_PEP_ID=MMETSP0111_2-20121227/18317_1 /TAXON_ID=91324 /ORGANISM="Lotharella globosa, Strain CCCM811" /LENGTH=80 /DNA_ID=CAMNT_0007696869 /DNA_START=75 /DNA_END=315 /DNA_ORIENTATION=-